INAAGVVGTMRLLDHSTLLLYSGSIVNMNVELFRNSGIDAGDNASIGGDLDVYNFSVAVFSDMSGAAVGGLVSCGIAQATSIDPALNASDLCGP
ncbi:MAG: hypothetical protein HKO71_00315, partial [Pseudomonadales bacterium]|nr:hypothetical protein [Pseudomonadales bacterium]